MSNNNKTLTTQIKRTLHYTDYRILFFGSIVIALSTLWMVVIQHPEIIYSSIFSHILFTLTMAGIFFAFFVGMAIVMSTMRFYEPRVREYVSLPKDIEMLKDVIISLGSYVASLDDKINTKKLGTVFLFIWKKFKNTDERLAKLENSEKQWKQVVSDISFKADFKGKQLDKFQTKLDDFIEYQKMR